MYVSPPFCRSSFLSTEFPAFLPTICGSSNMAPFFPCHLLLLFLSLLPAGVPCCRRSLPKLAFATNSLSYVPSLWPEVAAGCRCCLPILCSTVAPVASQFSPGLDRTTALLHGLSLARPGFPQVSRAVDLPSQFVGAFYSARASGRGGAFILGSKRCPVLFYVGSSACLTSPQLGVPSAASASIDSELHSTRVW